MGHMLKIVRRPLETSIEANMRKQDYSRSTTGIPKLKSKINKTSLTKDLSDQNFGKRKMKHVKHEASLKSSRNKTSLKITPVLLFNNSTDDKDKNC